MENAPQVKTDDLVRVVLEGRVGWTGDVDSIDGPTFEVGEDAWTVTSSDDVVVSVEVLPPPVETFGPGDTVQGKHGRNVYTITEDGYFNHSTSRYVEWRSAGRERAGFTSEHYERRTVTFE